MEPESSLGITVQHKRPQSRTPNAVVFPEPSSAAGANNTTVAHIILNAGYVAKVDAEDLPKLLRIRWYAQPYRNGRTYAAGWDSEAKRRVKMHQFILGRAWVDHRNGDGLDNRKENLRAATPQQNSWNAGKRRHATVSRFIGVSTAKKRWRARIVHEGRKISFGCFDTEEEAARVYDAHALRLRGEYARLNFPIGATCAGPEAL